MPGTVRTAASTQPSPIDQEISDFSRLKDKIDLSSLVNDANNLQRKIGELPGKLQAVRSGGYIYKGFLEDQAANLFALWDSECPRLFNSIQDYQSRFQSTAQLIEAAHARRSLARAQIDGLSTAIDGAYRSLEACIDPLKKEASRLVAQVDDIAWTIQQASQASFQFEKGESPFEAVPANWKKPDDKDGVEGVLYLTGQRLLFEQKEEVATKKVLFVTTAKQKVQALAWAIPVEQINQAQGVKRGLFGKDDYLIFNCVPNAAIQSAEIHLKGESGESWVGFINHVKSGAVLNESILAPAQEAAAGDSQLIVNTVEAPADMGDLLIMLWPEGETGALFSVGSELLIDEMHAAVLYSGETPYDVFGPGRHTLTAESMPLFCAALSEPLGPDTVCEAHIAFVSIREVTDVKWSTVQPVLLRVVDLETGMAMLDMFGTMSFKIEDPQVAVKSFLNASRTRLTQAEMVAGLRPYILNGLGNALGKLTTHQALPVSDILKAPDEIAEAIKTEIQGEFSRMGLVLRYFDIGNTRLHPEYEKELLFMGFLKKEVVAALLKKGTLTENDVEANAPGSIQQLRSEGLL